MGLCGQRFFPLHPTFGTNRSNPGDSSALLQSKFDDLLLLSQLVTFLPLFPLFLLSPRGISHANRPETWCFFPPHSDIWKSPPCSYPQGKQLSFASSLSFFFLTGTFRHLALIIRISHLQVSKYSTGSLHAPYYPSPSLVWRAPRPHMFRFSGLRRLSDAVFQYSTPFFLDFASPQGGVYNTICYCFPLFFPFLFLGELSRAWTPYFAVTSQSTPSC